MVSDFMLAVTSVLLFGTASALFLYYRRIIVLRQEYNRAKDVVGDIVISIDRQFSKQKDRVLFVAQKLDDFKLENKKVAEKMEDYDGRLTNLTKLMVEVPHIEKKIAEEIKEMRNKIESINEAQEKTMMKIVEIEKIKKTAPNSELQIKAAIPIKKEKALEPLNETELNILEMISREGEKTAPEIREQIDLTREHTARLMKKLYKDGYLERDTHKMPYVYRLKEEMEKILKKKEARDS